MLLIVDGDPLVYRSGFAVEQITYEVVAEDDDGGIYEKKFHSAKERDEWFAGHPGHEILDQISTREAEPVAHALQLVDLAIAGMEHATAEQFSVEPGVSTVLSGPGNYRYALATVRPYKGNRDPSHIPVHYQAIRNHLTSKWQAKVIHGREADDEVSIRGWERWRDRDRESYVIATIDKDLDQVPGWHYDYMKKTFYFVDEQQAELALWTQILAGDQGDNVPGCFRVGVGKARKLVTEWMDADIPLTARWDAVVEMYRRSKFLADCPYADREETDIALETARLVYMQRRPGELWNPPGVEFGTVAGDKDD